MLIHGTKATEHLLCPRQGEEAEENRALPGSSSRARECMHAGVCMCADCAHHGCVRACRYVHTCVGVYEHMSVSACVHVYTLMGIHVLVRV